MTKMNHLRVSRFVLDQEEDDTLATFEVRSGGRRMDYNPALESSADVPDDIRQALIDWLDPTYYPVQDVSKDVLIP
jgi:hypothetical protein